MKNFVVGIGFGLCIGCGFLAFLLFEFPVGSRPYMQGQIDAANGIMHYELVKQPDGSMVWKMKK